MNYRLTSQSVFPLVEITLRKGEQIQLESGAMVYHNGQIDLEGHMNANGKKGIGGALRALGRSVTSGESFFITTATGKADNAVIAIAPSTPGTIRELAIGATQWRLNTGAYLSSDSGVHYNMIRQNIGGALFGGTGGLFVMETAGSGTMLVTGYGDIMEVTLDGSHPFVVDNHHVVAWSDSLNYQIEVASGVFGFKTGEGLVNTFTGSGTILIQSRNIEALAGLISPYISTSSNN
mgnify:FL=1